MTRAEIAVEKSVTYETALGRNLDGMTLEQAYAYRPSPNECASAMREANAWISRLDHNSAIKEWIRAKEAK